MPPGTAALLALALVTLGAGLLLGMRLVRGLASLPRLGTADPALPADPPSVSIVVAARDEADGISPAVSSLLDQDYPDVEVVVVDDRSSDGTGPLLDRLARERPQLDVLHVTDLPAGWLGKTYALDRGAERAGGDLLLFTDADVVMRPDALRRAVAILESRRLDHLAVAPRLSIGGPWATMTLAVFLALFSAVFRPWRASDPNSRGHVGVGAFNLVRARAYRAVGGHGAVALRPDDDVRLGRILKEHGFRQAAALGRDQLAVEWYPSLRAMARGLRKNAFAVVDYRVWPVVAWSGLWVVIVLWPLAALFTTAGAVWWLNLGVVAVGAVMVGAVARWHGLPLWTGVAYPLGAVFLLWIVWAAMLRALLSGSVEWRGTRYALDELRGG